MNVKEITDESRGILERINSELSLRGV
jgi:hypothetical protein